MSRIAFAGFLAFLSAPGFAQDWPQWRGPNRDGVAVGAKLPAAWPAKLPLKWTAPAGPGYSTPVVAGGRVYFLERKGGDEAVRSLDADSGKEVWGFSYPCPYKVHPYAASHGDCPKSTTTVSGGRVFSLGISGILHALDASTGKPVWKRDLGAEFQSMPLFGTAASPLVEGGLAIIPVGHKESGGGLMAFRVSTGETAWRAVKDGPSYCSPIAAELGGVRQVICFTAKRIAGVALADGKELWSYPVEIPFDETIVTPIAWKDRVIFAGRNSIGTRMLKVGREGDRVTMEEVWRQKAPIYFSSPVISGDGLFGMEHVTGDFFCLRLSDGSYAWKEGNFGDYASLVLAGDRLLILDSKGKLTVIEASCAGYRPVASFQAADPPAYAHLVVAGSRLYVRDAGQIRCFDLGS